MGLRIAPIVEGHGEVRAIRPLLERMAFEIAEQTVEVLQAFRVPRTKINRPEELIRMIDLAQIKLSHAPGHQGRSWVLVLLDSDPDPEPPCVLGPRFRDIVESERPHLDVSCVFANREWETWFVAAAPSLGKFLELPNQIPRNPEKSGSGKGWIKRHFRGSSYSETADQAKMTRAMDLRLCQQRSPSFDKLFREMKRRLPKAR